MEKDFNYYKNQFFEEAREILDKLCDDILKLENNSLETGLLNSAFRGIHTIKGSSGSFELNNIAGFSHHLEALFVMLRDGNIKINSEFVDIILKSIDLLNIMLDKHTKKDITITDDEIHQIEKELIGKIALLISVSSETNDVKPDLIKETLVQQKQDIISNLSEEPTISIPDEIISKLKEMMQDKNEQQVNVYKVSLHYTDEEHSNGYDQINFLKNLKEDSIEYLPVTDENNIPCFDTFNYQKLYLHPIIYLITNKTIEEIESLSFDSQLIEVVNIQNIVNKVKKEENVSTNSSLIIDLTKIDEPLLKEFVISSNEQLELIENSIIDYEKTQKNLSHDSSSQIAINKIFRTVHTIKGDASYLGIANLVLFTHELESLLEIIKKDETVIVSTDIILTSVDAMKYIVKRISQGDKKIQIPSIFDDLKKYRKAISQPENIPVQKTNEGNGKENGKENGEEENEEEIAFLYQINQYTDILKNYKKTDNKNSTKIFFRAVNSLKRISSYIGNKEIYTDCEKIESLFNSNESADNETGIFNTINHILEIIDGIKFPIKAVETNSKKDLSTKEEEDISIEKIEKQEETSNVLIEKDKKLEISNTASELRTATIKVDETKIEIFSNLIGELIIARNTYDFLIEKLLENNSISSSIVKNFRENIHLFSRITNEMQVGIIALRMFPIKGIFKKFERVVRDISKKQGKKIELITIGEETDIDKKVADIISEPLIHLIRNACDHGIELPDKRIKNSKPEIGRITLKAYQEGRNLCIEVADDGKGLNKKKILQKAKKMNIDVSHFSKDNNKYDIFQLIFLPGFSTAEQVTDVSGRGVGMDVVMSTVKSLSGNVELTSEENKGTIFKIIIPMTMGITSALLVETDVKNYAIPLEFVAEAIKISPNQMVKIKQKWGFYYRGELIPTEQLCTLLNQDPNSNIKRKSKFNKKNLKQEELSVVILSLKKGKFGIIVDKFNKNMEIALKPIPPQLSSIKVISGVSIMGDGRIILVLNPEVLIMDS